MGNGENNGEGKGDDKKGGRDSLLFFFAHIYFYLDKSIRKTLPWQKYIRKTTTTTKTGAMTTDIQ